MRTPFASALVLLLGLGGLACRKADAFPVAHLPLAIRVELPKDWPEAEREADRERVEGELRQALGNPRPPAEGERTQGLRLVLDSAKPDPRLNIAELTLLLGLYGAAQGLVAFPVGPPVGFGIGVVAGPFVHQAHEKRIRELGWAPWGFTGSLEWGFQMPPPREIKAWELERVPVHELDVMKCALPAPAPDPARQRRLSLEALSRAAAVRLRKGAQPSASRPANP